MKTQLYVPDRKRYEESEFFKKGKCGPGGGLGDKLVPDKILGLSVTEACKIHDYMYSLGLTHEYKELSDRVFKYNMIRLIEKRGGSLLWPRLVLAELYYQAVSKFGGPAYWNDKNKEEDLIIL